MNVPSNTLREIVTTLIEKYPNTLPTKVIDQDNLCRLIGQQEVIRYLAGILEVMEAKNK